ncbi:hypothetical protein DFP91_1024 [Pseudorhodoplanes sinuspersici]|nr:hypothetical protein DFP91_1024 [Pseudorhodoplanes sinuspersici]
MIALPVWAIGAALLAVVALAAVAIARVGSQQTFGFFAQVAASLLLVGVAWLYLERLDYQDHAEQRRNVEARLSSLTVQALSPNSSLACLDSEAGEAVTESCEKAVYASPEQVAAALAYVGLRLDILRDIAAISDPRDERFAQLRAPLARSIEADRYGLVAQVLQGRDSCTPQSCYAFALVQRRDQLVANMTERAYDAKVVRYASGWGERQPSGPALASQSPQPTGKPVDMNFPTAASIPPVSIMSNEPGMPGQNGMDSTTVKPESKAAEAKAESRERAPAAQPQQKRTSAQKAAPKQQQPAPQAAGSAADPFPQPISSAQTTGGSPTPISPQ